MLWRVLQWFRLPIRYHFWGSFLIVLFSASVIGRQISDRRGFADGELYRDVTERWGAPIDQPAPSVRYVDSGTVFNSLKALPLEKQHLRIDAKMNYRRRGLVYFSGFDFRFRADYRVKNPRERPIDVVFVFPIGLKRNKVLLSNLHFFVGGKAQKVSLAEQADRFTWTGRLRPGQAVDFAVRFEGRGLDSLTYRLDPQAAVHDFDLKFSIRGGENYDYPRGVVPASRVTQRGDELAMHWRYASLESGVPIGVILPSEQAFDQLIKTMVARSWAPFLLLFGALALLAVARGRRLRIYEAYLVSAGYSFFFVLLAYFTAFMNFYLAYVLATTIISALLLGYLGRILGRTALPYLAYLLASMLWLPTVAVIAQGYTGLIYTLEILVALATLMVLTTRAEFTALLGRASQPVDPQPGAAHAQ